MFLIGWSGLIGKTRAEAVRGSPFKRAKVVWGCLTSRRTAGLLPKKPDESGWGTVLVTRDCLSAVPEKWAETEAGNFLSLRLAGARIIAVTGVRIACTIAAARKRRKMLLSQTNRGFRAPENHNHSLTNLRGQTALSVISGISK